MGPRNIVLGRRGAFGLRHWDPRSSSLYGHEALCGWARRTRAAPLGPSLELPMGPRRAVLGVGDACGLRFWDFRWSSVWGHDA
eukprot:6874245-Pyramimonas_sp.AAC.1